MLDDVTGQSRKYPCRVRPRVGRAARLRSDLGCVRSAAANVEQFVKTDGNLSPTADGGTGVQ